MATGQDIRAVLDLPPTEVNTTAPRVPAASVNPALNREARRPQPRLFKKPSIRARGRAARWAYNASPETGFRRWQRAAPLTTADVEMQSDNRFAKFNVQAEAPTYDSETYERHLTSTEWSKEETDHLVQLYRECNGKWPVIADHFSFGTNERSMEELKSRLYSVSAILLQLTTPITSMTAAQYSRYETLNNFNPAQETSRKRLAEGHLYRRVNEVDEETVLLGELQRIMLNQASLDSEREELRRRLDFPHANAGYQYTTLQQLTQLWQQLVAQDRMKKNSRLRPTGNAAYDGYSQSTPTSVRPRDSNAGLSENGGNAATAAAAAASGRRAARDSLSGPASGSATTPTQANSQPGSLLPSELSKQEQLRYGVVMNPDSKLPSGVTFASDKLSKPRVAKSVAQTDKISTILSSIGVPELIPIPTPPVIEQFESIMAKVHALLDLRKIAEKEEQELRVRGVEVAAAAASNVSTAATTSTVAADSSTG